VLYFLGDARYDVKVLKKAGYVGPDFVLAQYTLDELKCCFTFSDFSKDRKEININFFETEYKCPTISEYFELEKEEETIRNFNFFHFLRTQLSNKKYK
jgi:hypothetical protein